MPRSELDVYPALEYLSILDQDGNLDEDLDPGLDEELLLEMHRVMLLSRRFDDRRLRWQRSGRIGTFAPVKGQEAAQIGAVAATTGHVEISREASTTVKPRWGLLGLALYPPDRASDFVR